MTNWKRMAGMTAATVAVAVLLTGCSTTQMKGTPFYTGEYSRNVGSAEDRVNLWPLVYYRNPALSILWPIGEFTEDHMAVRPVFSVYGLHEKNPTYNVVWPLARFETGGGDKRIFPFFWGDDYFTAFPLYWHEGDPFAGRGHNALFPLWVYAKSGEDYRLHLLWPFLAFKEQDGRSSWDAWPLVGNHEEHDGDYRYLLWPLGHQWAKGQNSGSTFFPLYYYEDTPEGRKFVSLPYSSGNTAEGESWQTVFPLFHWQKNTDGAAFYSLPYSYSRSGDESYSLALPLWYSEKKDGDHRLVATPLGGWKKDKNSLKWVFLPAFSGGQKDDEKTEKWFFGPVVHSFRSKRAASNHVLPFYYWSSTDSASRFYSLPWSRHKAANGDGWQFIPPVMFSKRDGADSMLLTPLFSKGTMDSNRTRWYSVFPLLLNRKSENERLVATLLGGVQFKDDKLNWLIWPLLSGGEKTENSGSFWAAAPMVRAEWDETGSKHHVFPFYYWNGRTGVFASPLAARWEQDGTSTTVVPWTLSWLSKSRSASDLWIGGPLAHLHWGKTAGASHVLPFFYRNSRTGTLVTPLYGKAEDGREKVHVFPPLLSAFVHGQKERDLFALLGLFYQHWGEGEKTKSSLIPFYWYEEDEAFYTPLAGRNSGGLTYLLSPLVGYRSGAEKGAWVLPFWWQKSTDKKTSGNYLLLGKYWKTEQASGSSLFPLYSHSNSSFGTASAGLQNTEFRCLPVCWYRSTRKKVADDSAQDSEKIVQSSLEHGAFPLWNYEKKVDPKTGGINTDGSVLLRLYDYRRRSGAQGGEQEDYRRARILWRLWHYEKAGGNVSIDAFPAITYDKRKDGFSKTSFLWRLFRYEKDPGGNKKMDILFLPIMR